VLNFGPAARQAVTDPFETVDTIEPMDFRPPRGVQINALALPPDALWVVNDESTSS
jgi:hypothetical protein